MDEVVRSRTWLRERRQQLRAQISQLEDVLLDAGLAPAGTVVIPPDGDDYARLVEPFELYLAELRAQAFRAGHHPETVTDAAALAAPARSHGAPADWLDRLADAQRAQAAAETRAIRAEAARVSAEQLQARTSAALSHLYSAVAQLAGPGDAQAHPQTAQQAQHEEPAGGTSTIAATRTVLLAFGTQQPVTATQVGEAVSRVLGSEANPATIRSNLVRLRDASAREGSVAVAHDDELGVWWLVDPDDPTWRPPRGLRAVATER